MTTLAILGASGHGRVVADAALSSGLWQQICFFDDAYPALQQNGRFSVAGNSADLLTSGYAAVVAIGDNKRRLEKQQWLLHAGHPIATVCHASAIVAADAVIGQGSVILAGAVVNAGAEVGAACIINSRAVVEHDCKLADAVHLSPGACIGGGCHLATGVWVGIGAAVRHLMTLGEFSIVGAGAAVVKPVLARQVVAGVPAQLIKMNE